MTIQKQFFLRYHNTGHVRFQIPDLVCQEVIAEKLSQHLLNIHGVYSARIFRKEHKLAIHYHERDVSFNALASQLFHLLDEFEALGFFDTKTLPAIAQPLLVKVKQNRVSRWFGEKYQAAKETAQAAKLLFKISTQGPKALIKDPEKAITDFLTDVLVLYLIKIHWTRITQQWLRNPLIYRYEWMAVFYLFYLLVRSRRKK